MFSEESTLDASVFDAMGMGLNDLGVTGSGLMILG